MDIVSKEKRSQIMARVRSKGTRPERLVRSALHKRGYRFRLHRRDLPGNPDIVLPSRKAAIFVHGCFWHAHKDCVAAKIPATNQGYWDAKLKGNVARDLEAQRELRKTGWRVRVVWTCRLANAATRRSELADLDKWLQQLEL